ncbi:MAG: hypothetical protein IKG32_04505 [Clostridia bacterium]|nr:hypothetical protein [Clostridia bacterium]
MFEQRYTEANDRIHPRQDLLKEMQEKWAAEEAARAAEEKKVVAFPTWARYVSAAAGILLCVGLGMGSMLLLSKTRGRKPAAADMSAEAEAPQLAYNMAATAGEGEAEAEEPKIVTFADEEPEEAAPEEVAPETMLMASAPAPEPPQGMHAAMDEAEVEDAVRYGSRDGGFLAVNDAASGSEAQEEGAVEAPQEANAPAAQAKKATEIEIEDLPSGKTIRREELMAVFMPTTEQVHVVRRNGNKLESVAALTLRERGVQVKDVFWLGDQLLTVRERGSETELLRFDVANWAAPRHLMNLTQSGTFLAAAEMEGKLLILSRYKALSEEPFPWVNGERIDIARVLLDEAQPGDVFVLATVYDPAVGDFVQQTAILLSVEGALVDQDRLALWTARESPKLYLFRLDEAGFAPVAEKELSGRVAAIAAGDGGLELLLEGENELELLTGLDQSLTETASAVAPLIGGARDLVLGEGGAAFLTEDALHVLTAAGERALAVTGERLTWLAADRLLVISTDGKLHVIGTDGELQELWTIQVRGDMTTLLEEPDRAVFDPVTGRLVIQAGYRMYLYRLEEGRTNPRSEAQDFRDHSTLEQRELRCLLLEDRAVIFYKAGAMLCNEWLGRMYTLRY